MVSYHCHPRNFAINVYGKICYPDEKAALPDNWALCYGLVKEARSIFVGRNPHLTLREAKAALESCKQINQKESLSKETTSLLEELLNSGAERIFKKAGILQ